MKRSLQFLIFTMRAFKMTGKSTYITWLRYFDEVEGSQSGLVLKTMLSYWLS